MLKIYFVVFCFFILPGCKNDNRIVQKSNTTFELFGDEKKIDLPLSDELCTEPEEKKEQEFTQDEIKAIGRAISGVVKWKTKQGVWWECGEAYKEKDDIEELAFAYVVQIFKSAKEVSDETFELNPWGMLGVVANESRFDRCALGLHPRKKAYSLGIIKRRKVCISHSENEILTAVNHPKMKKHFSKTGFDLGVSQMLSRFYSDKQLYEKQIELVYGCNETARELRNRAFWKRTSKGPSKKPWLFWRGSATPWYDAKIRRWARMFGANKDEI